MFEDIKAGYYWLKNKSFDDRTIWRPIHVFVVNDGMEIAGAWRPQGTYFQWIGDTGFYHIDYLTGNNWQDVAIIPLEKPNTLKELKDG